MEDQFLSGMLVNRFSILDPLLKYNTYTAIYTFDVQDQT